MAAKKSKSKKAARKPRPSRSGKPKQPANAAAEAQRAEPPARPLANLARPGLELLAHPMMRRHFPFREVRIVGSMRQLGPSRILVRDGTEVLSYLHRLRVDEDARHAGHLVAMNALAEIELAARLMDPSRVPADASPRARAYYTHPDVVAFGLDRAPRVLYELTIKGGGFEQHFVDELTPLHLRVLVAMQEMQGDLCCFLELDWPPPKGHSDEDVELLNTHCRRALDRMQALAEEFAGAGPRLRQELDAIDAAPPKWAAKLIAAAIAATPQQRPTQQRELSKKATKFVEVLCKQPGKRFRVEELSFQALRREINNDDRRLLDSLVGRELENGRTVKSDRKGANPRQWWVE